MNKLMDLMFQTKLGRFAMAAAFAIGWTVSIWILFS